MTKSPILAWDDDGRTTGLAAILDTLAAGLEARIPGARAFVRIGIDAPVV